MAAVVRCCVREPFARRLESLALVARLVRLVAAILLLSAPVSSTAASPMGSDFGVLITPASDGVLLEFPVDLAVDRLRVPVREPRLWGEGNIGNVVVLRWAGGSGIGTRFASDPFIVVEVGGAECRWIEALPVRHEPVSIVASEAGLSPIAVDGPPLGHGLALMRSDAAWNVEAVPVFQRRAEYRLQTSAEAVLKRQQRQGCFSCHLLLPLYSAAAIAGDRGFRVPDALIASITESLVSWQNIDGSFTWPERPEYGIITPTAVAAAALARLQRPNPAAEAALQRSARFLVNRQNEDGALQPDFTFPGLVSGPEFTTRCLLEALSAGAASLARLGRFEPPACAEARRKATAWLDRLAATTTGPARELAWMALPLAGRFPEASRTAVLETLTEFLRTTDFSRDPARAAWSMRQLVLLGGTPPAELEERLLAPIPAVPLKNREPGESRELWRLMASLWFHFHRETNRGICR